MSKRTPETLHRALVAGAFDLVAKEQKAVADAWGGRGMSETLAKDLYAAVVQPESIWWDDLTPEMQAGWVRGAKLLRRFSVSLLARAICVEAESIESDPPDFDDCEERADHIDYARAIAREYGKLASGAQTPASLVANGPDV